MAAKLPYWRLSGWYFFYFAFVGVFSPYFGLYLLSLGFSAWDIGVLLSLMQVARIVAPNVWGWLGDRVRRQTEIITLAAMLSVAGFAGLFAAERFGTVFVCIAWLAFFWSAALPLVEAVTLGLLGAEVARYGRIRLWGSVGFIVAVSLLGHLLDQVPVRLVLWAGVACLAGVLMCSVLLNEPVRLHPRSTDLGAPLREVLGDRRVRALLNAAFCMAAAHGALYVFYSIYLVEHGYTKTLVGGLWSLGVFAEIGVFIGLPHIMRRYSVRTILLASFAAAVVRFLMIGWGVESLVLLVVAQLLHGLTFGAYHAASVVAVKQWFGEHHQARGQALYSSVSFGAGGMAGGLVSGLTWESVGPSLTYLLSAAVALWGFLALMRGLKHASGSAPV